MNKQTDPVNDSQQEHYFTVTSLARIRYSTCTELMVNDKLWPENLSKKPSLELLETLRNIEFETRPILKLIAESNLYVEQYFQSINKRIELIASYIAQSDEEQTQTQEILISEAAVSFTINQPSLLELNATMAIELVLLPNHIPLSLYGKISELKQIDSCQAQITVHFYQLNDNDRQQLAKHVLQRQREDRRKALL